MILVWALQLFMAGEKTGTRGADHPKNRTRLGAFYRANFTILLETAVLSEHELAEYCRKHSLYPEHLVAWRQNCLAANQPKHCQLVEELRAVRSEKARIRVLEKELRRKDKARAKLAVLVVLQEKFSALRDNEEDD